MLKGSFMSLPPRHFTPVVDFFSPELSSAYAVGLKYTARETDTLLLKLLDVWVSENKVVEISQRTPSARLHGV